MVCLRAGVLASATDWTLATAVPFRRQAGSSGATTALRFSAQCQDVQQERWRPHRDRVRSGERPSVRHDLVGWLRAGDQGPPGLSGWRQNL